MEDYVIGIRLALDNGVSAGLASIRADLTALDQSVAASAEGLKALSQSVSAAPLPSRQPAPHQIAANAAADQPDGPNSAIPPTPAAADISRPPVVRIHSPSAPTMNLPKPKLPGPAPAKDEKADTPLPIAPVAINAQFPPTPTLRSSSTTLSLFGATAPQGALATTAAPISQPDAAPTPNRPASPTGTPYAPPPVQLSSGPIGGDVYLDGERLGHWLASHLAREAIRPSYGGVDFDPNLSIAWPGASQGGQ